MPILVLKFTTPNHLNKIIFFNGSGVASDMLGGNLWSNLKWYHHTWVQDVKKEKRNAKIEDARMWGRFTCDRNDKFRNYVCKQEATHFDGLEGGFLFGRPRSPKIATPSRQVNAKSIMSLVTKDSWWKLNNTVFYCKDWILMLPFDFPQQFPADCIGGINMPTWSSTAPTQRHSGCQTWSLLTSAS